MGSFTSTLAQPLLGPSRLYGTTQDLAAFLRADVPPPGGTQTNGGSPYRRRSQLAAGDVKQLKRQIEEHFWRQAGVAHDRAQPGAPSRPERSRQWRSQRAIWICSCCVLCHTVACIKYEF